MSASSVHHVCTVSSFPGNLFSPHDSLGMRLIYNHKLTYSPVPLTPAALRRTRQSPRQRVSPTSGDVPDLVMQISVPLSAPEESPGVET